MKAIDEVMFWSILVFCVMMVIALSLVFKAEGNNIMGPQPINEKSEVHNEER